jgi:hypothetical protein
MTRTRLSMSIPSLLTVLGLMACGGTTAERVSLPVRVVGLGGVDLPSVGDTTVTLSEAKLHVGAVYFFEGEALFGAVGPRTPVDRAVRPATRSWGELFETYVLGVSVAYAHPGHYVPGAALGELIEPATLDLLAPEPALLGTAAAVTGTYGSARLDLLPADGVTATLRGTARTGTTTREWSATLAVDVKLEGFAFAHEVRASGGEVTVEVDLDTWIDRVDFRELPAQGGVIDPASRAHNALTRGVEDLAAYHFTFTPGS